MSFRNWLYRRRQREDELDEEVRGSRLCGR